MEDLIRNTSINEIRPTDFVDQSVNSSIFKEQIPSVKVILSALNNKDYESLSNIVIIPSTQKDKEPIIFSNDIWTNKDFINEGEVYRKANFSDLSKGIKLELKIIGIFLFWFQSKKAKVSSIIRIIENLIVISKSLQSLNLNSIYSLDRDPIRNKFMATFNEGKSSGTIDNYFKSLAKLCDMQHTFFSDYGFFLKTNFINYSPKRKSNQTYCMPIDILLAYWSSYINYFENLKLNIKNWEYISSLPYKYREYLKLNKLKHHNNNWLFYLDEYCQQNLKDISLDTKCNTHNLVVKRTDEDVNAYKNKSYTYEKIVNGKIHNVPLSSYNRRFPQYIVDMEDIYTFYNRVALVACEAIQAMSGLRKSEAVVLKFNCLVEDREYIGIKSTLFKGADEGGVEEVWAAAPYVKNIINKIIPLASAIFRLSPRELGSHYIKTNARAFHSSGIYSLMTSQRTSDRQLNWTESNEIYITKKDIDEFWQLNPNISLREKVECHIFVGGKWPIEHHQFRRSIAVHVRRLELVTMNQLSAQFKHIARTVTEWYSDGYLNMSNYKLTMAEEFAKELEKADLEVSAYMAMKFQNGSNLFGKGGKTLESQQDLDKKFKTYQSFSHAKSLAKRNKSKVMSLGNGMYCMNGTECDFKPVIQSSNCRTDCENLIADKDSIPIWISRYNRYRSLYQKSVDDNQPAASQEFLRLEMETYKQALEYYGVIL
ncbi:hypothetical protein [Vibrio sp. 99-70-13A1]|uniref:hypothetical protein n=1 Tax=Vibrio sp. 99-70-13A1 TaxID=2607601 RepID=UPI001493B1CC|nr:hypothetical protein [Vibrio sp. 99-70-13A1]NOH98436.1 hypothetical protein [Vibrio sp. 99-70-13A1]